MMMASQPIGVFDSGVGGLSVLREIRCELPHEDLLYVADSAYAPYGEQPESTIEARSLAITEFLLARGAKAIVVACNTATGAAARVLRSRYEVPVIAMEPAVKPAIERTRSGVVGVLATRRTLAGERFSALVAHLMAHWERPVDIIPQPCPGLVEQIESGDIEGPRTSSMLAGYINPLLQRGADTLVLGCTHYPHLAGPIRRLAGPDVAVLDSGMAVARQVRRRLDESGLRAPPARPGEACFWTSGHPAHLRRVMVRLWGADLEVRPLPDLAFMTRVADRAAPPESCRPR